MKTPILQSLEEIHHMMGVLEPPQFRLQKRDSAPYSQCQLDPYSPLPPSFDWRAQNVVTSVKYQGVCGSCWIFASLAALESALVIANKAPLIVDLSEQQLLYCVRTNGCQGGYGYFALDYVKRNGIGVESNKPYVDHEKSCSSMAVNYRMRDFCYRGQSRFHFDAMSEILTEDSIVSDLVQNRPLYI